MIEKLVLNDRDRTVFIVGQQREDGHARIDTIVDYYDENSLDQEYLVKYTDGKFIAVPYHSVLYVLGVKGSWK